MSTAGPLAPVCLASLFAFQVSEARADTALLAVTGPNECAAALSGLRTRLAAIETRVSDEGLRASTLIEPSGAGYRVILRTTRTGEVAGETVVTAPTCEEAADVAVVVLALAASSEASTQHEPGIPAAKPVSPEFAPRGTNARRVQTARSTAAPARLLADEGEAPFASELGAAGTRRFALSTGVDAGTLAAPTLVVAGALAKSFGAVELRGALRYGFASVEEEQVGGVTQARRSEFGALEGRACYGTVTELRVAACGGAELGAVWSSRRLEDASGVDADEAAVFPRLSGVVTAMVAHRGGSIQPELECSAAGVALGRETGGAWLVLRVSAGAAVAF